MRGGIGLGSLLALAVAYFFGGDAAQLLSLFMPTEATTASTAGPGIDDDMRAFVEVVLGDTEEVWREQFQRIGKTYQEPNLVLFEGTARTACGFQSAAVGPFYCPGDRRVYIDLEFFSDLRQRFGAPGDFAQAYVIAHEVGHHIQALLGTSDEVHRRQQQVSRADANELSVRLELQADFYAGLFAHHAQRLFDVLDPGDVEEALRAAEAIGDDRLQRQAQGYVVPESFTHGTSAQRQRWFLKGFRTGDIRQGDTFSATEL